MSSISTYARFYAEEESRELCSFLGKHGIPYQIEKDREVLDKIYIGDTLDPLFNLKIRSDDFSKVNELVLNEFPVDMNEVAKDYYLFNFTSQELLDVIENSTEWNYFDRALARKILSSRDAQVNTSKPPAQSTFTPYRISVGMLLLEYIVAIVLAYAGIIIGVATLAAYKTISDGTKVKMYDEATRNHAYVILAIGIVSTIWNFPYWLLF